MPKTASVRARMDPQLKEEAEAILQELGMSTTQALTLFYQQIRLKRGIPFDVRLPSTKGEGEKHETRAPQENGTPAKLPAAPFPVDRSRSIMEQNVAAYQRLHSELVEQYLGQYVAICDGELVDHDPDPVLLLTRIRNNFPNQVVLRRKVELAPERELRICHPRIERVA